MDADRYFTSMYFAALSKKMNRSLDYRILVIDMVETFAHPNLAVCLDGDTYDVWSLAEEYQTRDIWEILEKHCPLLKRQIKDMQKHVAGHEAKKELLVDAFAVSLVLAYNVWLRSQDREEYYDYIDFINTLDTVKINEELLE
jgi:hypothetical protein